MGLLIIQTFFHSHSLIIRQGGVRMADIQQIQRAIDGDDDAFLHFIFSNRQALFRIAIAYLKNEEEALEAIQEVTFRAYSNIHTLKKPQYAKTWLIRIMLNYCRDTVQRQGRMLFNEKLLKQQEFVDNFYGVEVEELLQKLSFEDRELIYLKYLQDYQFNEIAEMTNTPESTVKTRFYRAFNRLKTIANEKEELPYAQRQT